MKARIKTGFLARITMVTTLALSVAASVAVTRLPQRPNLLFLFTDDQRWDTVHALGNPQIKTPTFDRLVEQGFHFRNAFCQGSMIGAVCLPSRTMLATGRSLWRIPENPRAKDAPPGVPLLPAVFNEAGYATFHCGKAGNACTFANAAFQTNITLGKRAASSATEMADHAIEFLKKHDPATPFFMYLAPPVPHDPRLAPDEFMKLYDPAKVTLPKQFMATHPFDPGVLDIRDEKLAAYPRTPADMKQHLADYYATITHLDHETGRILDVLKQRGLDQNTVIIFSSDQGLACGGYHALMGKQNLYEDVKPPLVIAGPGIPHGRSDALVYLFDLFPTLCDLGGVATPPVVEGKSLLPVVMGQQRAVRDWLFGAYSTIQRMVRNERWKLYKFNVNGQKHSLLFDLQSDPGEIHNLAGNPRFAGRLAELEQQLARARQEFGDPMDFDSAQPIAPPSAIPPKQVPKRLKK